MPSTTAARALAMALFLCAPSAMIRAQIVEYPTTGAGPESIVNGPDGALWFTETTANKIGRVTTQGAVSEFSLAGNPGPAGITTGADGNLWFTERISNKIGRITPSGVVTEFPTLTPASEPVGITAAGDGNLWFTERFVAKIGRITTQGVITEYAVAAGTFPNAITEGSDGNLWFTEETASRIGRITPTGAIQSFPMAPLPGFNGAAGFPRDITSGPDGKIWYAVVTPPVPPNNVYTGAIGHLDPQSCNGIGLCSPSVSLLNGLVFPQGIASGPDGVLWVSDRDGNSIARVSTAGALLGKTPIPTAASSPRGITAGPDGGMWFAESAGKKIGRIDSGVPGSCVASPDTLCLSASRFMVTADFRTQDGRTGSAHAIPLTSNTGYFWFFDPTNVEVVTKVLPFCANPFNSFWIFAAGLTNVQVTLTYTDTNNGTVVTKTNALNTPFAPVQDTAAFKTCP